MNDADRRAWSAASGYMILALAHALILGLGFWWLAGAPLVLALGVAVAGGPWSILVLIGARRARGIQEAFSRADALRLVALEAAITITLAAVLLGVRQWIAST